MKGSLYPILFAIVLLSRTASLLGINPENRTQRGSLENSRFAFEHSKKGRVAFMGGSITEMNGYRPMMMDWLQNKFPQTEFEFVNAGISSTCSTTGAFRLERDVLSKGPIDLLFLEFAVNDDQDARHSHEACILGMEGIIRNFRSTYPKGDLVVTYFVNPGMLEQLRKGKTPLPIDAHERVLEKYQVSRVHLARELAERIEEGSFTWEEFGGTHPKPPGNRLCADIHAELLGKAWDRPLAKRALDHPLPKNPLKSNSFFNGRFLSPGQVQLAQGWNFSEPDWETIPGSKRKRYLDRALLHADSSAKPLTVSFSGRAFGVFVVGGPDAGKLAYEVDGKRKGVVNLYRHFSKNLHYPFSVTLAHDLPAGQHQITLTPMAFENRDSVRILEFCLN